MRRIVSYIRNNRGQSMVEFALVLPVFLLLVAGMMEFGRVMNQYLVVTEAAREGARSAAVGNDDATVIAAVNAAASTINQGQLTVTISPSPTRTPGDPVTVTVSNPVELITPLISQFFAQNPVTVQGKAVMRVE
ncbi:Hypothetical protein LUCI_1851 [Lucifera butyrica]|uniref:TadE-like domain-containing protein n=1 Tax=Lucifera butyrica TaxID=1351585 RepID=A0A498R6D7_9FIRM|nr:TadE/TadG family type IV pilus assembly protein [Lucifera butyrica]VBB06615.1 Hypothetical protein LUCI_1851 [Lucifera butyrica]